VKNSRYGDGRSVVDNGHGVFTVTGKARYYRVGMNEDNSQIAYFDPEGGPFISVGDDLGFGRISEIVVEKSKEGSFKIRVQVD
jgi:hypothetical protein